MIGILNSAIWIGWGGFALAKLWGWFLIPLGIASVSWWQAAGLLTTFTLLSGGASAYAAVGALKAMDVETKHCKWVGMFMAAMIPAICLGSGWVIKTLGPIVDAAL